MPLNEEDLLALQKDVTHLKRITFGYVSEDENVAVDGLLQQFADAKATLGKLTWIAGTMAISIVASMFHNWAAQALVDIGKMLLTTK